MGTYFTRFLQEVDKDWRFSGGIIGALTGFTFGLCFGNDYKSKSKQADDDIITFGVSFIGMILGGTIGETLKKNTLWTTPLFGLGVAGLKYYFKK